jgi:integrase
MRRITKKSELWQPEYRDKKTGEVRQSAVWWMTYWVRGERRRESTGMVDYDSAYRVLQAKKLEVAQDLNYSVEPGRLPISKLLDLVIDDYTRQGRHSLPSVKSLINGRLRPCFGSLRAADLTTDDLHEYQDERLENDAQNASVNREMAMLRRAFRLGIQRTPPVVLRVPYFPMLPEENVREGLLDWTHYVSLRDALPERVQLLFVLAFHVGARRGELLKLEWIQVDFERCVLRLKQTQTKNKRARSLPFYGDMHHALLTAHASRPSGARLIFTEASGEELGQFRKSWATACKAVGVPGLLFHDLRRTAVVNMIDAGMSESEAMLISGHKTNSIFKRYDIVTDGRLAKAADKLNALFHSKISSAAPKEVVH